MVKIIWGCGLAWYDLRFGTSQPRFKSGHPHFIFMKTILVDAVNSFIIKGKGIFKEMQEILEEFPNKKIILTNADDEELKKFGLDNLPYLLFTLKHKPNKTSPEYYQKMLSHFSLKADEVVYFEHNPEAVKSAESVGIKTFHYDPIKKDLVALKKFLKENL